jgi:hypothetical protein
MKPPLLFLTGITLQNSVLLMAKQNGALFMQYKMAFSLRQNKMAPSFMQYKMAFSLWQNKMARSFMQYKMAFSSRQNKMATKIRAIRRRLLELQGRHTL